MKGEIFSQQNKLKDLIADLQKMNAPPEVI